MTAQYTPINIKLIIESNILTPSLKGGVFVFKSIYYKTNKYEKNIIYTRNVIYNCDFKFL